MGSRVPVQHYNLRSANPYSTSLHDLNTVDGHRPGEIDGIGGADAVTEDSLDNEDGSNSVDCISDSYKNSIRMYGVEVEDDRSTFETSESSRTMVDMLTSDDILPIETTRARFLQVIVDNFITEHVIELPDSEHDYNVQCGEDKLNKRKSEEAHYEGDPRFALPLMYAANLYENLVLNVNRRLASLDGIRDSTKTIGVALEAAGGLYRKLAKKYPRKGPYSFKRRELATSLETRARFPELVINEEKRVRFVVVNGLEIVEKPNNMPVEDAEWFKRLTGRSEVAISDCDYKFYTPRHKNRRVASNPVSNIPGLPAFSGVDNSPIMASSPGFRPLTEPQNQQQSQSKHHIQPLSLQPQFHHLHQTHHQTMHQNQHASHFSHAHQCSPTHLPEISHTHQLPSVSQHMACLQSLTGSHMGGRMHVLHTTPAKYCDECGAPYLRESSKFCSECGVKRLGT
ncbi:hypothetical protein MKX01_008300 [Papaver californicum]|nr:hypothetical protein MKX01_008300 [Papaver californicum]